MRIRTLHTILIVVLTVAAAVLVFSMVRLLGISTTYREASDYYSHLQKEIQTDDAGPYPETHGQDTKAGASGYSSLRWNYEALKKLCPDAVGYIFQDGTISYPVVQAGDNEKYLRHMMNGEYNIAGTIFMDYQYPGGFDSAYSVVYGHNMDDGSMFGTITDYRDEDYYKMHPEFEIYSKDKCYRYYVFAAFQTSVDSFVFDYVENGDELVALARKAQELTPYETAAPEINGDSFVTVLSTCIDYPRDYYYRYVVFLVRGEELANRKEISQLS